MQSALAESFGLGHLVQQSLLFTIETQISDIQPVEKQSEYAEREASHEQFSQFEIIWYFSCEDVEAGRHDEIEEEVEYCAGDHDEVIFSQFGAGPTGG